jgi:integrase
MTEMTANSPWMDAREAAAYLKVRTRSLLLWVRQGKVQAYALSGTRRRVWRFRREKTMVILQLCLGLRVSELLALRWQDVDWMGSKLNVEHGIVNQHLDSVKTEGSRKTMTLDAQLLQILAAWKQTTQFRDVGDWLFPSPVKLGRLSYSHTGYWRALQTAAGGAGLGRIGTHTFRHSYRSWLDSVGTAITVQQKLMRHSDIQTTLNIYGDVVTDEKERASAKVATLALNPDSKVISAAVSH